MQLTKAEEAWLDGVIGAFQRGMQLAYEVKRRNITVPDKPGAAILLEQVHQEAVKLAHFIQNRVQ